MNISIRKTLPANFAAMAAVGFAIVFCMTIAMAAADTTSQGEAIASKRPARAPAGVRSIRMP